MLHVPKLSLKKYKPKAELMHSVLTMLRLRSKVTKRIAYSYRAAANHCASLTAETCRFPVLRRHAGVLCQGGMGR